MYIPDEGIAGKSKIEIEEILANMRVSKSTYEIGVGVSLDSLSQAYQTFKDKKIYTHENGRLLKDLHMKTHIELAELFRKSDGWVTVGTDTQYQFIETEDETILVFSESNTLFDWVTNINFPKQPYKQMDVEFYVHRGYLREWKRIQDVFVDYFITKLRTGDAIKPITITGWSYGGAMAVLTMESLWYTFPLFRDSLRLVTFGCPRVIGFKKFQRYSGTLA